MSSGVFVPGQEEAPKEGIQSVPGIYVPGSEGGEQQTSTGEAAAVAAGQEPPSTAEEDIDDDDDAYDDDDNGEPRDRARPNKKPNKKPTKKPSPAELALKKEFMMMDLDNSGFIDKGDLAKASGGYIPEAFFVKAIKLIDTNRDGKISFEEYKIVRQMAGSIKEAAFGKKTDAKK